MSRRRFYAPGDSIRGDVALLPHDQAHHLRDVLRLKNGDAVEVFDGEGAAYSGKVRYDGERVRIESLRRQSPPEERRTDLILAQALLKADRFEWVLQKATELGVSQVIPLETRFCDVRVPESRIDGRMERWRRIVREASRQSCRHSVPEIRKPMSLSSLLALDGIARHNRLFLYENASVRWDSSLPPATSYLLCVGPEGGWHPAEAEAASGAGFTLFNLGPRILRAETAALAAVTLIQFQIADVRVNV